eukprot:386176-Pelagomonas_calceolata.AAC.1
MCPLRAKSPTQSSGRSCVIHGLSHQGQARATASNPPERPSCYGALVKRGGRQQGGGPRIESLWP